MTQFGLKSDGVRTTENPRSATLTYILAGPTDRTTARVYGLGATPTIVDGLWRQDVRVSQQSYNIWHLEVSYGPLQPREGGSYTWEFDTTGGTALIKQAKAHIQSYNASGTTTDDHDGAIGVNESGDVEGCEIITPAFRWSETWNIPVELIPWSYSQTLKAITGRVNSASFRGFAAGEVRFDGGKGRRSTKDPAFVEIVYSFTQSDNATGLSIGGISGIAKEGWQYLWVEYERQEAPSGERAVTIPIAVHVERVYDAADFYALGIGG